MLKNFFEKLKKIILIFAISLISRLIINYYFEINVFTDSFHYISILYYLGLSSFTCIISDLLSNNIFSKNYNINNPYIHNIFGQNVEINPTYEQKSLVIWLTRHTTLHDFSEFCDKYKSSLAKNYSNQDLININAKLLEGLSTSPKAYEENVKRYMPKDIAVFYGMHLHRKYGTIEDQIMKNPSGWITK